MRTTITLQDDVAAAVERLRRERGLGLSEAVNELVRAGLVRKPRQNRFRARSHRLGLKIAVDNVAETLEQLEEPTTS
jgi:hypothetical protein